ncbi:MAG: B12-binding domain-containing radical SAM protein [Trueperaceae bacterium]|nr:MAG: B12-binding domain-containing radical SAM protein [Trueperaceae bacterium]
MATYRKPVPARPLRIALISPRGPLYRHKTGIWKRSLRYAPLTLTTLAALIPEDLEAKVTLVDEGLEEVPEELEADLIGISAITGTAPRAYELADRFRKQSIPVVLGGVHPTLMPDEAQQHADAVVVGYAEESWPRLLDDFCSGGLKARYVQDPALSLAGLPYAKRELLTAGRYSLVQTIEATRGCLHGCEFCVVPTAWGGNLKRPVAEVIDEIRQMRTRRLLFLDLNLIADTDYAKELFGALIPLNLTWGGLVTTLITRDEELLNLIHQSGCRGLLLGFESLSPPALRETRKGFNLKQDYTALVKRLHERGIAVMGCFVFGFDHDADSTFAETVDFVQEVDIDLPRYAILTPFPATPLFKRLKHQGRILSEDWSLYDAQHVVFEPANMTPDHLFRGTEWAWKETYRYRSIFKRLAGARIQLPVTLAANLGYRFYARHLHRYYTCDWGRLPAPSTSAPAVPT